MYQENAGYTQEDSRELGHHIDQECDWLCWPEIDEKTRIQIEARWGISKEQIKEAFERNRNAPYLS
jgi:hypothetical protein